MCGLRFCLAHILPEITEIEGAWPIKMFCLQRTHTFHLHIQSEINKMWGRLSSFTSQHCWEEDAVNVYMPCCHDHEPPMSRNMPELKEHGSYMKELTTRSVDDLGHEFWSEISQSLVAAFAFYDRCLFPNQFNRVMNLITWPPSLTDCWLKSLETSC